MGHHNAHRRYTHGVAYHHVEILNGQLLSIIQETAVQLGAEASEEQHLFCCHARAVVGEVKLGAALTHIGHQPILPELHPVQRFVRIEHGRWHQHIRDLGQRLHPTTLTRGVQPRGVNLPGAGKLKIARDCLELVIFLHLPPLLEVLEPGGSFGFSCIL